MDLLGNIKLGCIGLPMTNPQAYLIRPFVTKENSFKMSTSGVNVIKLFSFVADDEAK